MIQPSALRLSPADLPAPAGARGDPPTVTSRQGTRSRVSSRLQLVVAASGHSSWRCTVGSAKDRGIGQALPILCLSEQLPASARMTCRALSAQRRHRAQAAYSLHSILPVVSPPCSCFCIEVIMITMDMITMDREGCSFLVVVPSVSRDKVSRLARFTSPAPGPESGPAKRPASPLGGSLVRASWSQR